MDERGDTIKIRKVRALGDRAREEAKRQELDENDLVIVKTVISSLPKYEIQKIEGSPTQFLQKNFLNIE